MTDQNAQEPTMEEILASIRRIISEDDAPAETPQAQAQPASAPQSELAAEPADEDVLELTDRFDAPEAETIGDLDVADATPEPFHAEPAAAAPQSAPQPTATYDRLVGESAAASAASAFAGLAASFRQPEAEEPAIGSGPTIDELARALLRPLLKEWLDANLPGIVEAQVRKEVERIARNAG